MKLKDTLYGNFVIDSPLIIELLKSPSVQRLKKISQYGIPDEYYFLKTKSRYDHSISTMLLLRKLGASEEEQVAGLLHDVSHTAFSHIVDLVVGSGATESFQDEQHENFISKSEIPKILKKYGVNPKRISNYKNFTLLEQEIPDLCADRIDYSLQEFSKKVGKTTMKSLAVRKGRIVFTDLKAAKLFAETFLQWQIDHLGSDEAVSRYYLLGEALKKAVSRKIINFKDFWQYDQFVINKLKNSKDKEINNILDILRKTKKVANLKKGKKVILKKFRYVDPQIVINEKVKRLTDLDKGFKKRLESARKANKKGVRVPLVEN